MRSGLDEAALRWALRRGTRIAGVNPWEVAVRSLRSAAEDRVTGLAAEMAFFALLSMVPLLVALGAALGFLQRIVGAEGVVAAQAAVVRGLHVVFSAEVADGLLAPLVEGLLTRERGHIALSGLVVAIWLASRVFTATITALDLAYDVPERRNLLVQRMLAVAFAIGFVVLAAVVLLAVVVGPLLGGARLVADRFGLGDAMGLAWDVLRWPVLLAVAVGFFAAVYRYGPNARARWRQCLPGAVLAVGLWILATVGLRVYLATMGAPGQRLIPVEEGLAVLGGGLGAIVAVVLWTYLSGVVLLLGGEVNAELQVEMGQPPRPATGPTTSEQNAGDAARHGPLQGPPVP